MDLMYPSTHESSGGSNHLERGANGGVHGSQRPQITFTRGTESNTTKLQPFLQATMEPRFTS